MSWEKGKAFFPANCRARCAAVGEKDAVAFQRKDKAMFNLWRSIDDGKHWEIVGYSESKDVLSDYIEYRYVSNVMMVVLPDGETPDKQDVSFYSRVGRERKKIKWVWAMALSALTAVFSTIAVIIYATGEKWETATIFFVVSFIWAVNVIFCHKTLKKMS